MNKGFVVSAQNTKTINYVDCAIALAFSIKNVMPNEKISIITDDTVPTQYLSLFDKVIALPYGDLAKDSNWKLINDWQVYDASPYEYTIKLEADMYVPRSIDYIWDALAKRDLVVCNTIRNYKQEISKVRFYRNFIDTNKLPDVYNAITYFRKSEFASKFFMIVRDMFENWESYKNILICDKDEEVTTDWAYSIACHILGIENTTLPNLNQFSMIHMKQYINNIPIEDWTKFFVTELYDDVLRIGTIPQEYIVHYHIKHFAKEVIKHYE